MRFGAIRTTVEAAKGINIGVVNARRHEILNDKAFVIVYTN